MALEEIERLKEKIARDPNSKLFVPLAEEYKKAGMIDEAIDVLLQGLERQPGYLSARVSLGKIYIEKSMPDEAKTEFEKVIAAIPDNLYAHKKLAEIYRDLGQKDKSIKEFKTVLTLNPVDELASTSLSALQDEAGSPPPEPPAEPEKTVFETTSHEGEIPPEGEVSPGLNITEEDLEIWESSDKADEEEEAAAEKEPPAVSISEEDLALWKLRPEPVQEEESGTPVEAVELPEEALSSVKDISGEPVEALRQTRIMPDIPEQALSIADADRYILGEDYAGAMNIYRGLLALNPDDKKIIQRAEELKALLRLLGKDKEDLIAKLDGFLGSVKKRRDEFFGSP